MQSTIRSRSARRSCGGVPLSCVRTAFALSAALLGCATDAAQHRFSLLLDTDSSLAAGCAVNGGSRSERGFEQVWTTVVTTSAAGAIVTRIELQTCTGGTLSVPSTFTFAGWSAGVDNDTGGTTAIESFVSPSFLPAAGMNGGSSVSDAVRCSAKWNGGAS